VAFLSLKGRGEFVQCVTAIPNMVGMGIINNASRKKKCKNRKENGRKRKREEEERREKSDETGKGD